MTNLTQSIGQGHVKALASAHRATDVKDVETMKSFLTDRLVFDPYTVNTEMRSIATGIAAAEDVNIHQAFVVGTKILKQMAGTNALANPLWKVGL